MTGLATVEPAHSSVMLETQAPTSTETQSPQPLRGAALTAAISLFVMVAAVIVAIPWTVSLIDPKDASKTTQAIVEAGVRFRIGILAWFVVQVCDILVAWALFVFFKPTDARLSLLTAWFRVFYTALFAVALFGLLFAALILGKPDTLSAFSSTQQHALILLCLNVFRYGWMFALAFFGIHLLGLGVLALKMKAIPRIFGTLLLLAAIGYVFDSLAFVAMPNYDTYASTIKAVVSAPNAIGELALACWLLFKGRKLSN